jgi:polysaccharide export outer membrane protein
MKALLKLVLTLISGAALCGAQNQSNSSPGVPPAVKQGPPTAAQAPGAASTADQPPPARKPSADGKAAGPVKSGARASAYVIGPLDLLMVKVWNNPNLSGMVAVAPDGMVSLPLIGEVKADGLTAAQLKETLTQRLGEYLNNPEVDATVAKINSKRYFVYGGVLRGGEFPLIQETTIMDALSGVGGFREFANTKKIYILRGNQKLNFNYKDVSKGKNTEQNILLQNGDRIFVPE